MSGDELAKIGSIGFSFYKFKKMAVKRGSRDSSSCRKEEQNKEKKDGGCIHHALFGHTIHRFASHAPRPSCSQSSYDANMVWPDGYG